MPRGCDTPAIAPCTISVGLVLNCCVQNTSWRNVGYRGVDSVCATGAGAYHLIRPIGDVTVCVCVCVCVRVCE